MKKDKKTGKLFFEALEKRISTSPLLVHLRSAEGLGMIGKFKSFFSPNSQSSSPQANLTASEKTQVSDAKFIGRIEKKQEALNNMAFDRSKIAEGKAASDAKFLGRIEKKQASLNKMAFDRDKLSAKNAASDAKFIGRLEKKQASLNKMAFDRNKLINKRRASSGEQFIKRIEKKHENLTSMAYTRDKLIAAKAKPHSRARPNGLNDSIARRPDASYETLFEKLKKIFEAPAG